MSNYPQQPMYQPQPQQQESFDLFKNVDKSTWIIAFAVFLLGFFMGKTMQPVILRYTWVRCETLGLTTSYYRISASIPFHELSWIHGYDERISCIFDKSTSGAGFELYYFSFLFPFVFWIPRRYKKQNKEHTRQYDCDEYGNHLLLYMNIILPPPWPPWPPHPWPLPPPPWPLPPHPWPLPPPPWPPRV